MAMSEIINLLQGLNNDFQVCHSYCFPCCKPQALDMRNHPVLLFLYEGKHWLASDFDVISNIGGWQWNDILGRPSAADLISTIQFLLPSIGCFE